MNVALVNFRERLNANVTGLQWIVDGYALVFASFLLTGGALSGPLLGGVLVNAFGWRSIFLINLPFVACERKDRQPSGASIGTVSSKNLLCHQCRRRLPDLYVHGLPVCHEPVPATGETLFAIAHGSGTASCIWLCPPGDIALWILVSAGSEPGASAQF